MACHLFRLWLVTCSNYGLSPVQIMACHLFKLWLVTCSDYGLSPAKPLSEPMLPYSYCQVDPGEQISVKCYVKFKSFHSRKYTWKMPSAIASHFISASMCLSVEVPYVAFGCVCSLKITFHSGYNGKSIFRILSQKKPLHMQWKCTIMWSPDFSLPY